MKPCEFFCTWPDLTSKQYKIIEGANYSENQYYENTVAVDYEERDTRYLYIEIIDVGEFDRIEFTVRVKVYDNGVPQDYDVCGYYWVAPL